MENKKFRWAFVGCGGIANSVAKVIVKSNRHEIVSCYNRTFSKAEEFGKKYGAKVFDSVEGAVNCEGVDGVYIAVTVDKHAQFSKIALNSGKAVLCEKPFTVNCATTQELFDLAANKQLYLCEAMWTWFNSTAKQVKQWVDSGVIGQIVDVNASYCVPILKYTKSTRHTDLSRGGGMLIDCGIYPLRYTYGLFGMPKSITATGKVVDGIDYGENICLGYDDFTAKIITSNEEFKGEFFEITGTKGKISVPWFHMASKAKLCVTGSRAVKFVDRKHARSKLFVPEFDQVAEEIRSGKLTSNVVTKQSTLDTMKILDECRRQLKIVYPFE